MNVHIFIIVLCILFLVLLVHCYRKLSRNSTFYDIVIVGGGISGTFMARRLTQFYPNLRILLIEKTSNLGGRIKSLQINDSSSLYAELGAMRLFPKLHPIVYSLLQQLNIQTLAVAGALDRNITFQNNTRVTYGKLPSISKEIYPLYPNEYNQSATQIINTAIQKTLFNYSLDQVSDIYTIDELTDISYKKYLLNNVSPGAINYYIDTVGFNLFTKDISASVGIYESLDFTPANQPTDNDQQLFIVGGYSQVPYKLCTDIHIIYDTQLLNFHIHPSSISLTVQNKHENYTLACQHLILAMPTPNLYSLYPWPSSTSSHFNRMYRWTGFKLFVQFTQRWWNSLSQGFSTTDLPLRQVWYYDKTTLMIYCDEQNANFWRSLLPSDGSSWISLNEIPDTKFRTELVSQLSLMFGISSNIISPTLISWQYWPSAIDFWKPGNIDINSGIYPFGQNTPVYIVSDSWSLKQGWIEGALTCCQQVLSDRWNIPSILDVPIK